MANNAATEQTGRDLRRDRRFGVSQAALIVQIGYPDLACEIRDFCLGGLFLKFSHPETAIPSLEQRVGGEVEIVFTPSAGIAPKTYRVPAQLKRLSSPGVGVVFVRQPVEALRALQKLRMAEHRLKLASQPVASQDPQLRDVSITLLSESLIQVHEQMMRMLPDALSSAAIHASGIAEHSALLNAMSEFDKHAIEVQTGFIDQVLGALKQTNQVQTYATRNTHDGELSLVDEVGFEDWLATSSEAQKLEEQFQEQLFNIEPRIGQLFGFACDRSNNPFGPAIIGHAYRSGLLNIPVSSGARQVAYAALRDVLSDQLAALYAELLALLPISHAENAPAPAGTKHSAAEAYVSPARSEAEQGNVIPLHTPAVKGTLSRLTGSLMDFLRGQPAPAGRSDSFRREPSMALSSSDMQGSIPYSSPEALPQHQDRASAGVTHSPVLQRLATAGTLPAATSPEIQSSVAMFGALFDTMHAEKSITEGTRPLFQQMESTLVRLALADPQFLSTPSHPAHTVLNTLDRISMVAGDDGKITDARLLRLMSRWTDRINAEADKNPGVFEEARTQLERVVKPLLNERSARIFRLQEMCEGRQRAEVAKQRILRDLLMRMDERRVPNPVIELLNGGWRNVLLIAEMRHGVDSQEAHSAWQVLKQLCEWLDPEPLESPATVDVQSLLQRIDHALTQVCADKFAQDRIVDQLATALFDENRLQHQHTAVAVRLNDATSEPLTEIQDNLAERLRVGDWLQFTTLETPLNLIWIGDQPPVYVFANYRGIKKLDLKRQDLLQTLEAGGAAWTEDLELPLMDRSYSAMIQKMQRDLLWQSSHDAATGLPNRKYFFRAIRRNWLRNNTENSGFVIGIMQLDISTPAGEITGADIRNAVLRELATSLSAKLPPNALLVRAGESGLAFWSEADDSPSAHAQTKLLLHAMTDKPQEINGIRYTVRASAGLMWARDCLSPESYYDNANAACTHARESDSAIIEYSHEAEDPGVRALAQWAHELTDILVNNQLSLLYQPVCAPTDTATPIFYDVQLHPVTTAANDLSTRDLIAIAERLQRVTEIDRWVVKNILQWMREHPEKMQSMGGFAINLSGQSLTNPVFLKLLLAELTPGDIPGNKLIFALSEADAVDGHAQTQLFMRQLQRHGCRFMLSEFGAGSSSFTSLKSMRLDYLKIDRALMHDVSSSLIDDALVRSILETGNFLTIKTVAGSIDDAETLAKLGEMGVDCVQGEWIGEARALDLLA